MPLHVINGWVELTIAGVNLTEQLYNVVMTGLYPTMAFICPIRMGKETKKKTQRLCRLIFSVQHHDVHVSQQLGRGYKGFLVWKIPTYQKLP